ncbi:YHS domain-containing (seleno)protein [Hasllibacter sp. MH4015]|uniref:YHS domain-containing (seleno)protein n=1 Tax=Hasllibacter sp. MH4015 TaxID=2854029 RepID=UPI001CD23829|nr:YHS domain-containing (seleno)protein [Hasllibacter sp. MH4015]
MPTRRTVLGLLAATAPSVLLAGRARAMEPQVFATDGVAINGADPVAYFGLADGDDPVQGHADFALEWNGATWHFANAENRALFEDNPGAYAPAYGGYCAFAAARGYVADTVPEAWSVVDGRLFLNYSLRIRRRWLRLLPDAIRDGDANWPGILG